MLFNLFCFQLLSVAKNGIVRNTARFAGTSKYLSFEWICSGLSAQDH